MLLSRPDVEHTHTFLSLHSLLALPLLLLLFLSSSDLTIFFFRPFSCVDSLLLYIHAYESFTLDSIDFSFSTIYRLEDIESQIQCWFTWNSVCKITKKISKIFAETYSIVNWILIDYSLITTTICFLGDRNIETNMNNWMNSSCHFFTSRDNHSQRYRYFSAARHLFDCFSIGLNESCNRFVYFFYAQNISINEEKSDRSLLNIARFRSYHSIVIDEKKTSSAFL